MKSRIRKLKSRFRELKLEFDKKYQKHTKIILQKECVQKKRYIFVP